MTHLLLVGLGQSVMTKTPMTFRSGPGICGHSTEWSDVHRAVRFDDKSECVIVFTEVEYQLLTLLVANYLQKKKEVSYGEICSEVFGCAFYKELLPIIRKRICAIRKKISDFDIDIMSVPHRGYEIRDLASLSLPYRRGHRAQVGLYPIGGTGNEEKEVNP